MTDLSAFSARFIRVGAICGRVLRVSTFSYTHAAFDCCVCRHLLFSCHSYQTVPFPQLQCPLRSVAPEPAEIALEIATTSLLKSVHFFKVSNSHQQMGFHLSKNVPVLISSSKTLPLSRSWVAITRSQTVICPIARQASAMCHLRSPFSHTEGLPTTVFAPHACSMLAVGCFSSACRSAICLSKLYNAVVKSSCGDLITSSAVAVQMGRERSASHVSRQPHKSRVLPAYISKRSTTNTQFTCVSHRAVSATLRTSTQSDCAFTTAPSQQRFDQHAVPTASTPAKTNCAPLP